MFGGIGSAVVALKLNGIAMKKIIHVDHDKVATHVHKWNHDPEYNPSLTPDYCEHIHYNKFEDIADNLDDFLDEHGRTLN
jgi:C-5 cytosine-specific DNA methylase